LILQLKNTILEGGMRDFLAVVTVAIEQIRSRARILMIISGLSANTRAFLLFLIIYLPFFSSNKLRIVFFRIFSQSKSWHGK